MTEGPTFDEWVVENGDEIDQMRAFSETLLSDDTTVLGQQLSRAQSEHARAGFLLAEAETFYLLAKSRAARAAKEDYPGYSAEERKAMAHAHPEYLKALKFRNVLEVIVKSLHSKAIAIQNTRNFLATPGMSTES